MVFVRVGSGFRVSKYFWVGYVVIYDNFESGNYLKFWF